MDRWASLYLLACTILGDENLAGDLVLRARDEGHLEEMLRQRGELPQVRPAPTPAALEHVAYLRRRARRRRTLAGVWVVGALAAVVAILFGLARWRQEHPPARAVYAEPAIAQEARGELELKVHRAEAAPGVLTIWWSLAGASVGLQREAPSVMLGLPDGWKRLASEEMTVERVNRDLIHGQLEVEALIAQPSDAQMLLVLDDRRFDLEFPLDRTLLERAERRIPVGEVMSRAGVGILVEEIVLGPGYARLIYEPWQAEDSPFRLLTAPPISRVVSDLGPVATHPSDAGSLRLGPLDGQVSSLRLSITEPMRVQTNLTLPLREGEREETAGLRIDEVEEIYPGVSQATLVIEGPAVWVESSSYSAGGNRFSRHRLGIHSVTHFQDLPAVSFAVRHPPGEGDAVTLRIETLYLAPPEELAIELP